jgi:dihydrofolate synthase / folylpolyglutamate synthase
MSTMSFDGAIGWLEGFQQFGMNLGLDRINALVEMLGHPEKKIKTIHVAGTNGKGSVCRYITSVLLCAGYNVGLYVSPHLETILERFSINNVMITKGEFTQIASDVRHVVDSLHEKDIVPTYFEITTAMMFLWFAKRNVDYAVIEVGLGGRYDATNIITPLVSIITTISQDHTKILGDTVEKIAYEKAGIIKPNIPVVTGADKQALQVIQQEAEKKQSEIYTISPSDVTIVSSDEQGQTISYKGILHDQTVETQNLGSYQRENVAIALLALDVLQTQGLFLPEDAVNEGIKEMKHPGRMEVINEDPLIILDGAHNPSAMHMLKRTMKELFEQRRIIVVFGVMADKAVEEIIEQILCFADHIIVTHPDMSRAMSPEDIQKIIASLSKDAKITMTQTVTEGLDKAIAIAKTTDIILVTGSLFTVGEARTYLIKRYANG